MSLSTDVSQESAGRLLGSLRILSGSRTAASPNTGMFCRMKRPKPNRRAACRCLATASLPDPPRRRCFLLSPFYFVISSWCLDTTLFSARTTSAWAKSNKKAHAHFIDVAIPTSQVRLGLVGERLSLHQPKRQRRVRLYLLHRLQIADFSRLPGAKLLDREVGVQVDPHQVARLWALVFGSPNPSSGFR